MNAFETLSKIDVSEKVKEKNRLSYLPWAWAWGELKKLYPQSFCTIYENADGMNFHSDGRTCWVKTGVTLVTPEYSLEHIEYLPVMNHANRSVPLDQVTSMDVNKAIQRSLTKAVARHGLGLSLYAGEDLWDEEEEAPPPPPKPKKKPAEEVKRSAEAEKIFVKVEAAISAITKDMNADQKKAFAKELKSICGTVNYKAIEDAATLKKLYDAYVKE